MTAIANEPLTRAQLADEGEVDEAYIERLVEIGALHPTDAIFGWADLWRVRTMRALEDAGMPLERIAPLFQSGRLNLAFLDNMLSLAPRTGRSFGEFAASLGEHEALAGTAYEMLGLAHPLRSSVRAQARVRARV